MLRKRTTMKAALPLLATLTIATMIVAMTAHASTMSSTATSRELDRDKSGTNQGARSAHHLQELKEPSLRSDGSFDTEREGFESGPPATLSDPMSYRRNRADVPTLTTDHR